MPAGASVPRHAGAVLTVDLDAIAANWRLLQGLCGDAECGAVVKADGYGLGALPVGRALAAAGCRRFFVAAIDEGVRLRDALPADAQIYVLNGLMGDGTAETFDLYGLVPVLNSPDDIARWSAHAGRTGTRRAILALDTGMARLGLSPAEVRALAADPGRLAGISLDFVMSHLACAEDRDNPMNDAQRRSFDELRAVLPATPASLANSGGIFLGGDFLYDLARPGAALYGVSRSTGATTSLSQVVALKGKVIQVRVIDSESTVGYGATCRVRSGARLATVAVGYADGYFRTLSNNGHGYADGIRVPVVGRVSMDLVTFDISDTAPETVRPGSDIDLIGDRHTVDDLAEEAGTIGYEVLTALGQRYRREYTGGPAAEDRT
ncbi:MAG: alanine racemase [Rhodospirillaceae bacterium]